MRKIIDSILVIGFLLVDFLIFHDLFKPGERYTLVEFLTGFLSILVLIISVKSLLSRSNQIQ